MSSQEMKRASQSSADEARPQLLRFGVFELDVRSGELRRNGHLVRIQPQPLKVLILLVSRAGEVVTREEVQAEVWPAGTYVDFEQSLNFCIRQIRTALGDSAVTPRYVETLPRRGYRWVGGPVQPVTPGVREWPRAVAAHRTDEEPPASREPAASTPLRAGFRRRWLWLAASVAAAVVLVAALLMLQPDPSAPEPRFQRLTFRRGHVGSARFSPDGQIVFDAAWDGQPGRVQTLHSDPRDVRALDLEGRVVGFSEAGEVALLRDGTLVRAPLVAGAPKEMLRDVVAADLAPGGRMAIVRKHESRFRIEFPPGRVLAESALPSDIRISPDGRYLAANEHPVVDDDRGEVVVFDQTGKRVASSGGWASLEGLAWARGGAEVWFSATREGADNVVLALTLDGRERTVLAGMGRLVLHDVAPDGRALLERATLRSELFFRREGDPEDRELSWFDVTGAAGLSADGSQVLFYESGQGGGADYLTFLRRTDGSPPVRVGTGRACGLSADGQWVATLDVRRRDHVDLTPTGPGEPRELRVPGLSVHEMAGFVGDGRLLFVTGRDAKGTRATWLVDRSGRDARRLPLPPNRGLFVNSFSPDGSRYVIPCSEGGSLCIHATPGSGAGETAPSAGMGAGIEIRGAQPGWRIAGWDERGRMYFRDRASSGPERLWRLDPATGRSDRIAELVPRDRAGVQGVAGVAIARSGQAWAFSVMRRLSDLHVVTGLR